MEGNHLTGKSRLLQLCVLFLLTATAWSQAPAKASNKESAELQFVIYLSRHGVRSPTGKAPQYNAYSSASWPTWDVPPGYLTPHGARLMELFGTWDREELASKGLLHEHGCEDASHVTVYADSDQRTQETGKALAKGLTFRPLDVTARDTLAWFKSLPQDRQSKMKGARHFTSIL